MAGKRKISAKSENDASAVTIAASTEESFPRGGASALTPLEHREISNKVAKDLFASNKASESNEAADSDEPAKKKRKPSKKAKKAVAVKDEKPKSDKTYIEQLKFKKLTVGTAFLGCISHINELDLFVSLPHQLVGVVPITEISDAITAIVEKVADEDEDEDEDMENGSTTALPNLADLFHVGQWIRCKITALQTDGKKVIELSLKPGLVNEDIAKVDITPGVTLGATVKSVEDHGYILDLGVKDLTGFLSLKESKSYIKKYNRGEELAVGQYVECAIEKTDARTANVTIDRTKIGSAVVEDPFSRITSILPGQLVTGVIDAVQNNGLGVKMQGLYAATIDQSHIPASRDIEKEYKLGQSINFRTLFTILNTEEKRIGGSVLPHVLELDVPTVAGNKKSDKFITQVFPAGSFLEKVQVARANKTGIWVTLDGVSGVSGYVHVSRLADEHIESVSATAGKFKIGSTHRARVLTYNPVDALLVLTLQPSVLAEKFLRVADIEIGSMVECEVEKLIPAGIIVKVSKSINGLVPTMHMADVKLTRPEFKFKVGKKIQCRVFKVDLVKQKVFLTLKKSLINSEYPIFKDINKVKVDDVSHGVIVAIKNNGCVVSYYNNLTAFAPGGEMTETHVANLSEIFNVGQTVKTTVLNVDPEKNKMLVSFINSKKKAEKKAQDKAKLDAKHDAKNDALAPGKIITATIKSIKKSHITLSLPNEFEGRIHVSEVYSSFDDIKNPKSPLSQFRSKQEIQVKILGVRSTKLNTYLPITHSAKVKQHVDCSLLLESKGDDSAREIRNIKAGDEFIGFISDIHPTYVHVSVGSHTTGTMQKQLASSDPNICNNLAKHFVSGQAIRAVAIAVDANKNTIEFMNAEDPNAPRITDISDLKAGQIMNAVVKYTNKVNGVTVNITGKIAGKAYLTDITDTYNENPTASCTEGQVVRIAIINVNKEKGQVDVSMRPSRIYPDIESNEIKSFEDIKRGQVYEGYVSNISAVGVFVKLNHSIAARVKIANLSDSFVKEWKDIYRLGQLVKVKIIYIDYDMKRLEASLKKSVVEGLSSTTAAKDGKKEQQVEESDSDEEMPEVDDSDEEMEDAPEFDSDNQAEQDDDDQEEDEEESAPALNIDSFDWTGINNRVDSSDEEEEEDSDDEDQEYKSKDKKKKKEVEDLTAQLNSNAPQTASDFERLLVGSPNSSYLWINFMAHQLQLSEIAKARDIGERALKTINFREEQEKMNVWVALLNLENNFGTDETLQEVFKRAIVYCEPLKVYLQLVKIYERSDKQDKAEALWEEMTKKFGSQSPEVWTGFGLYYLEHNKPDEARALLQKSLKVLPKHEHVKTIVKFAQLEFKHGEAERGRTIFEGVMSNYPKRLDLWNIYIDMEIKTGDNEMTRRLFERVVSMKFSSKKMKFLFKKWIQFEKTHGTEDDVQRVKEKTLAYVESMS
ncbi:hypothetical protein [Parasitella parasitica]|uniref:Protein RRP5 homolog n=1 Tax=Parasitella parasitica TaxID=35722 RepID=A0A0B7NT89_9FUNG|nr:hypothetical protein [Parasitella parasitica]